MPPLPPSLFPLAHLSLSLYAGSSFYEEADDIYMTSIWSQMKESASILTQQSEKINQWNEFEDEDHKNKNKTNCKINSLT